MTHFEEIEPYLNRIDDEEIIEEDAAHLQWSERDYAKNLLIRSALLVKFMALEPVPKFLRKKQIELIRERLDSIERMIEEE